MMREKIHKVVVIAAMSLCAVTILVRFGASFFPSQRLWGLSHLGYFSLPVRIAVTLGALVILVPWVNRSLRAYLKAILKWFEVHLHGMPGNLGYIAMGVGAWMCFYLLRQKTYFLGDARGLLVSMELRRPPATPAEPLGVWIPFFIFRLISRWHFTPQTSYAVLSCTAGVLFLIFALTWGKTVIKEEPHSHWFAFGIIATLGVVQQFFGYVENYSLLLIGQMAYFILGFRTLEGRTPLIYPMFLLVILITLHLTSLMLIPSLILLWVATRRGWTKMRKAWAFGLGALGALLVITLAVVRVGTPGSISRYALPLTKGPPGAPGYSLFSAAHLMDIVNLHCLASPVAFPMLLLALFYLKIPSGDRGKVWFLLVAAAAQIIFITLFDPLFGAARDWDLLSATGTIAFTLLLTFIFSRTPLIRGGYVRLVLIWCSFFSTVPFITLNALERPSVQRAQDLALLDPFRARGNRLLAVLDYYKAHNEDQMIKAFKQKALVKVETILGKVPENATGHFLRGVLIGPYGGDVAGAHKEFLITLEKEPDFPNAWSLLAQSYEIQGRYWEAIACFERFDSLSPDHSFAWDHLGNLYYTTHQVEKARQCYEKLSRHSPERSDVWINLGAALGAQKNYREAENALRQALRLKPEAAMAHYNLGNVFLQQGKLTEAAAEFEEAVRLDPKSSTAYYRLGEVLVRTGRFAEAEEYLRAGLALAPNQPVLHYNLSLALQGLGKAGDAQKEYETFQRLNRERQ